MRARQAALQQGEPMNLVMLKDGKLDLAWTWFPYWLVVSPAMTCEVKQVLQDAILLNGVPAQQESLDALDELVIRLVTRRFAFPGLGDYLRAMKKIEQPQV
jgi:hypothetical protein